MKIFLLAVTLVFSLTFVSTVSISAESDGSLVAPQISQLSPTSATAGATVTIYGSNFSTDENTDNIVYLFLNDVGVSQPAVSGTSGSSISFKVPAVSPGLYYLAVFNGSVWSNTVRLNVLPAATQPSITVTSPNGHGTYKIGEAVHILWTATAVSPTDRIYLIVDKENGTRFNLGSSYAVTGWYDWAVPANYANGNYKILISEDPNGNDAGDIFAESDYFTITSATTVTVQPSITVTSPNGGERYTKGETQTSGDWISYRANILNGQTLNSYRVYFTERNDALWRSGYFAPQGGADGGTVVPISPYVLSGSTQLNQNSRAGTYYLLVEGTDNVGQVFRDFSDSTFTITAPTLKPNLTASTPTVALLTGTATNLPNTFFTGSTMILTSTISNSGGAQVGNSTTLFQYMRNVSTTNSSYVNLTGAPSVVGVLSTGANTTATYSLRNYTDTQIFSIPGDYYIRACADYPLPGVATESNETDNCSSTVKVAIISPTITTTTITEQTPVISSVVTPSVAAGAIVTIRGSNFNPNPYIIFHGNTAHPITPSAVTSAGDMLDFVVPSNVAVDVYTIKVGHMGGVAPLSNSATISVVPSYMPSSVCAYTYSAWSACSSSNTQTRSVNSSSPSGCSGTPITSQSCTPVQISVSSSPTLSVPSNGATDISAGSASVLLQWNAVAGAGSYYMQVATDSGFNSIVSQWNNSIYTLTYVMLNPSTTYYWRVKTVSPDSNWSPVWSFTTKAAQNISSTACAYTYSNWGACSSSGQQTRTISSSPLGCVGTPLSSTQSCTYVAPQSSITVTSPTAGQAIEGKAGTSINVRWAVQNWPSDRWVSVQLLNPDGSVVATGSYLDPSGYYPIGINANQTTTKTYRVRVYGGSEVSPNAGPEAYSGWFSVVPLAPTACTYTTSDWTPSICPVSGQQTRTVSASPAGCSMGTSPTSTQSCTPVQISVSSSPTLSVPSNGATDISAGSASVLLQWNAVAGAGSYYMQVATDSGFNSIVSQWNNSIYTLTYVMLNPSTTYYWRVKTVSPDSNWSPVWSFTTKSGPMSQSESNSQQLASVLESLRALLESIQQSLR